MEFTNEIASLWEAIGKPEISPTDKFSWLPDFDFNTEPVWPKSISTPEDITNAVIAAQKELYYAPEIEFLTSEYEGEPTPKAAIYASLWTRNILNEVYNGGFKKDYSGHNVSNLFKFLDEHNIYAIYDPCASWGQRLCAASSRNIPYTGSDINKDLFSHYDMQDICIQRTICAHLNTT